MGIRSKRTIPRSKTAACFSTDPVNWEFPFYSLIHLQVKKAWKDGRYELFFGSENLLDFKQPEPVLNAASPFDPGFDATIVWAPIMGRVLFVGVNLKF